MFEIDQVVLNLLKNAELENKRSLFFIYGSKSAETVPFLVTLRKFKNINKIKILWYFKNENNYIKRSFKSIRGLKKATKQSEGNSFYEKFVMTYDINWCHFKDVDKVLGTTYDVCILQDFQSLTPNTIAKVIETIRGGGIVIFLLNEIENLNSFGQIEMDCHKRYKTNNYDNVDYRFNYRFLYSIASHNDCLLMNDKFQISSLTELSIKSLRNSSITMENQNILVKLDKAKNKFMKKLNERYEPILKLCATKDQMKSLKNIIKFIDKKSSDTQKCKVAMITSGRGRGKSALLGMLIALSMKILGKRVIVTSPQPENVETLMEFVVKTLECLNLVCDKDYKKIYEKYSDGSTRYLNELYLLGERPVNLRYYNAKTLSEFNSVRMNCELLCIDETAAVPLVIVKSILKQFSQSLIFMSSTIHGYEGTGRSLSLKLMKDLKDTMPKENFCEIQLKEPIRYSSGDCVEHWLNDLLCLNCDNASLNSLDINNLPAVEDCQLFQINRDCLFSSHPLTEQFLQQIMSIYVSSHYKNTPNDLQMLADSSSHALFCLAKSPNKNSSNGQTLPKVCVLIQLAYEGNCSAEVSKETLDKGLRPSGDMGAWTIASQFQDFQFPQLSGARIIRIAVHPDMQRHGYGARALKLLHQHFTSSNNSPALSIKTIDDIISSNKSDFQLSSLTRNPNLAGIGPLLIDMDKATLPKLDYLSVSYGLTQDLYRFWKKNGFIPVYIRQTMNEVTGEYSCIMLKQCAADSKLSNKTIFTYHYEFSRRFCQLLSGAFRTMDSLLALDILHLKHGSTSDSIKSDLTAGDINLLFNQLDFQRIDKYLKNAIDYYAIMDLICHFAFILQTRNIKVKIPKFQNLVLLGLGLQHKTVNELTENLEVLINGSNGDSKSNNNQVLGHLKEALKSITKAMKVVLK